jgi:hypothetical protein
MTCFDDWYMFMYNSVFTMAPLFIKAVIQQDVNYQVFDPKNQVKREYFEIKVYFPSNFILVIFLEIISKALLYWAG